MVLRAADLAVPHVPVEESSLRRMARFAAVLGLHALFLLALWQVQQRPAPAPEPIRFAVRVIELPAPATLPESPAVVPESSVIPLLPPPQLPRPEPRPVAVSKPPPTPVPVVAVPPPPLAVVEGTPVAPAPARVTAARFDAAYLNNPAPRYPLQSRRRGEQGQVLLRVQVDARGLPEWVEIHQGSGHARLDEAALVAVRDWRFVPARRGEETVAASVLVPIRFQME